MTLLKNKIFWISIILWCFITVVRILNHVPWFDEAHAWTISEQLNLFEIFKFMKIEGHTFIWYLLLMPFAKTNFHYPYSMQFLNWGFCLFALIIFWAKAPFNNWVKFLITFSFPFLAVYSVYARCYSIGIMFLFLLAAFFKNKLNRPVLYSILLIICANTSGMALVGTTAFGILFLYDIIKSKIEIKKFIIPLLICTFGAILILIQLYNPDFTAINDYKGKNFLFRDYTYILLLIIGFISIILPVILFVKKSFNALFFIAFTYGILTYCFLFKYYGHLWNHYFFFIYLIISMWVSFDENKEKSLLKNMAVINLAIIAIVNWFALFILNDITIKKVFASSDSNLVKMVINDKNLKNETLIIDNIDFTGYMLLPYKKVKLKNYCDNKEFNYDVRNYPAENDICYSDKSNAKIYTTLVVQDRLGQMIDKEAYALLPIEASLFDKNDEIFTKDLHNNSYIIKRYKCPANVTNDNNRCIYKIKKLNSSE